MNAAERPAAADHVASMLRTLANQPPSSALDRKTWRVAMLSAARIIEEDADLRVVQS